MYAFTQPQGGAIYQAIVLLRSLIIQRVRENGWSQKAGAEVIQLLTLSA